MRKFFVVVLTTLAVPFTVPFAVFACDDSVPSDIEQVFSNALVMSELLPAPVTGDEEFIELHNIADSTIHLDDWKLIDASGKTAVLSGDISAGAYVTVEQTVSKIYLNNDADELTLLDPNGAEHGSVSYESAPSGESWSLIDNEWQWTTAVTPGSKNIAQQPPSEEEDANEDKAETDEQTENVEHETSDAVLLNELLPAPEGDDATDEWIEITNTGSSAISLDGWQITDQTSFFRIEAVEIGGSETMVFEVGETGISLNNSGDTVYLIDPFGAIVHGTTYESADDGQAWARFGDTWEWTDSPTPGESNVAITTAEEEPTDSSTTEEKTETTNDESEQASISVFRSLEDDQSGVVEGIVSVVPGILGSQYFYMQDDTAGIQVYSYSKQFPDLSIGDRVRVTGIKSTARGETRIKTTTSDDIVVIESGQELSPTVAGSFDESLEGMLTQIEGTVLESTSSEAIINDDLKVVFKSGAAIDSSTVEEGTVVTIAGIVGEYDGSYRLMPRSNDDIAAVESEINVVPAAEAASINPQQLTADTQSQQQEKTMLVLIMAGIGVLAIGYALRKNPAVAQFLKRFAAQPQETKVPTIFDHAVHAPNSNKKKGD